MAENINFISATELPEATGEEVSVLCLENGEMKQKPANGLGDGGVDLELSVPEYTVTEAYTTDSINIVSGSIESVMQKVNNGELVNIVVRTDSNNGPGYVNQQFYDVVEVSTYGESIFLYYRNRDMRSFDAGTFRVYTHTLQLSPDGTLLYHNWYAYVIANTTLTNA